MTTALALLKRYWPVLVLALTMWAWGNHQYDAGYAKRDLAAVTEKKEALEEQANTFRADLSKLKNDAKAAEDLQINAEKEAITSRKKADDYYAKWQEAKKHVPLTTVAATAYRPFTVGFVGLQNLSIKGAAAGAGVSEADIAAASGVEFGAAGIDLSQAAKITADDVLQVDAHNYKILHTCLGDRATMAKYLEKLHEQGFYR